MTQISMQAIVVETEVANLKRKKLNFTSENQRVPHWKRLWHRRCLQQPLTIMHGLHLERPLMSSGLLDISIRFEAVVAAAVGSICSME